MPNANETFMVLIVVGTLALIFMMKGSPCFSGGGMGHPSHCGCHQCRHGLIGIPKDGLKGIPRDGLTGVPYEGLKGLPDSFAGLPRELANFNKGELGPINGLTGVPYEDLKGLPDSFAGLPGELANFNKGELGPINGLTGMPYENFAGVLKPSNTVWGDREKSEAAWKKVEEARLSGKYTTSKYTSGDISDLSTTCSFAPTYSDALDCMGLPVGGPDSWYSWDDAEGSPTKYLETSDLTTKCALVASNYQDAMKCMSLEPDVGNSHEAWISNIQGKTTTASKDTIRDDPNDINPWVGLRRPKYKTRAQPLAQARTIASDVPGEMLDNSGSYDIN